MRHKLLNLDVISTDLAYWAKCTTRHLTFTVLGLVLLFLTGCAQAATPAAPSVATAPESEPDYEGIIVAIGDSLTEGLGVEQSDAYPAQLERKLQSTGYNFQVVNAGVSGETSSGTLSRIDWVIDSLEPDIVILETGPNDGLRGVDPAVTEQNLTQIIEQLQAEDLLVVLAGMQIVQNLGDEYTTTFAEIYPRVAEKHDLVLIPFFLEGVAAEPTLNQQDGVHPTAEGYELVTETVFPHIVEAIELWRGLRTD